MSLSDDFSEQRAASSANPESPIFSTVQTRASTSTSQTLTNQSSLWLKLKQESLTGVKTGNGPLGPRPTGNGPNGPHPIGNGPNGPRPTGIQDYPSGFKSAAPSTAAPVNHPSNEGPPGRFHDQGDNLKK
jgi:hypothetical protein